MHCGCDARARLQHGNRGDIFLSPGWGDVLAGSFIRLWGGSVDLYEFIYIYMDFGGFICFFSGDFMNFEEF